MRLGPVSSVRRVRPHAMDRAEVQKGGPRGGQACVAHGRTGGTANWSDHEYQVTPAQLPARVLVFQAKVSFRSSVCGKGRSGGCGKAKSSVGPNKW